jgi:signal transduction histidine kinase
MVNNIKSNIKILIVEDDYSSQQILKIALSRLTDNVFVAKDGLEGLEMFQSERPSIIITDISMPRMNGLDMASSIKVLSPKTPIIILTAHDNSNLILKSIEIGVNGYLLKPLKIEKINEMVMNIIHNFEVEISLMYQERYIRMFSDTINNFETKVVITNSNLDIEFANNSFVNLLESSKFVLNVTNFKEFYDENESKLSFSSFVYEISEIPNWKGEFVLKSLSKSIYLTGSASTIIDVNGLIKNFIFVLDNISHIKENEKVLLNQNINLELKIKERTVDLEIAKQKAEAANQAKSLFLAKVSHELRTPMTGILGVSNLLLETEINEKQLKFLKLQKTSGESLLRIINQILDFTKLEAGKENINVSEFDMMNLINSTIDIFDQELINKNIKINFEYESVSSHKVIGDYDKIKQVLINLIANAIKFSKNNIIILNYKYDIIESNIAKILFFVKDFGIGIPKDKYGSLFKSFSQIDNNLSRSYGGTGLGLVICKEFIELMNGKIYFESEENVGSTFFVELNLEIVN